ncbi:MAG: hypothetical protein ACERKT_09480, partial [Acidobacteriota bacterium]
MTALDWGIAAFTFLVALWGFRQGLIVGVLGLAGLAIEIFNPGTIIPGAGGAILLLLGLFGLGALANERGVDGVGGLAIDEFGLA